LRFSKNGSKSLRFSENGSKSLRFSENGSKILTYLAEILMLSKEDSNIQKRDCQQHFEVLVKFSNFTDFE